MHGADALGVGQDRLLLLHPDGLAVLLVDVLETRDGGVVLHEADSWGERDNDRDVEVQVALAALLARRERATGVLEERG